MTNAAAPADAALDARLAEATLALVDIPSESWQEESALIHSAARLNAAGVPYRWGGGRDAILAGHLAAPGEVQDRPFVILAGHLDTVPAQGNIPGRIDDEKVHGLGSTDMKGACAVMTELLCDLWPLRDELACCVGVVLFAREELPFGDSALTPLLAEEAQLSDDTLGGGARATSADLAVVMEPTAGLVQAGCLGNLNATLHFSGTSAHSARPWQGENALDALGAKLVELAAVEPIWHEFAGLRFAECVTATGIKGGVARNVVPGAASIDVNYRYAPGTSAAAAERTLAEFASGAELEVIGHAPSGAVTVDHPLAQRLIAMTGAPPEPKQAWTPVAEFTLAGVDAINYGPGEPSQAHQVGEWIDRGALLTAYRTLESLLTDGAAGGSA